MKLLDLILSYLKGDTEEVKAIKIEKKAKALFKIHISRVENAILKAQDRIDVAKENYNKALVNNGSTEFSEEEYVNGVIKARQEVLDAEDELARTQDTLKFLKETYDSFDK